MGLRNARVPLMGFAAFSGTGKTSLLLKVLPLLRARGLRIGMVKHAHHGFDVDHPGKDSYALRKSGAVKTLVFSRARWALMVETDAHEEPGLDEMLANLDQSDLDLVLVEGFKLEAYPKIEVHRPSLGKPLLFPRDDTVVAIATDGPLEAETALPILDLNDPRAIGEFVIRFLFGSLETARGERVAGSGGAG